MTETTSDQEDHDPGPEECARMTTAAAGNLAPPDSDFDGDPPEDEDDAVIYDEDVEDD